MGETTDQYAKLNAGLAAFCQWGFRSQFITQQAITLEAML